MSKTITEVMRQADATPVKGEDAAIRLLRVYRSQLNRCSELLTKAGVPEWVDVLKNDGVPANDTISRLEWFIARRKDIKPEEWSHDEMMEAMNRELQDMDQ